MSSRLWGIIAKEFIQLWRDRLALTLALFVPVAMLFIFGWAINTDVKHVPTAVFDQSGGVEARTLLEAFTNSQYFDIVQQARSHRELTRLIDGGAARVGIVIPPDFGRQLTRQNVSVQVIVDASDPQVATSAMNAAAAIGAQRSLEILTQTVEGTVLRRGGAPVDVRVRAWYNPDLVSAIFMFGTLGIGIFVSAASRTVPQAMQLSFLTFLPSIYLSGLLFPIEGMPPGAQVLASAIPLTYYLRVVRGIVLKGIGLEYLWSQVLPLLVFGAVVFTLSILRFRKQLE